MAHISLPHDLAIHGAGGGSIIMLVMDGLGGLPHPDTGLTELESAATPHLDALAARSSLGMLAPVGHGITPGSGPGHLALFGYDPVESMIGRGVLSALGVGFELQPGDVAARLNLATVDQNGIVTDRRAGRPSDEAGRRVIEAVRSELRAPDGVDVTLVHEKEHRAVLVLQGQGLGADRDRVLISTKFGRRSSTGGTAFTAEGARLSVEASLRRLATDRIDVLFFHSPFGANEIADDVWEGLDSLKEAGKVRVIGHSISKFEDTQQMARDWSGARKIEVVQVVYSLMNRESTRLIQDLGNQGVGVFAREALANGFLSGQILRDTSFPTNNLNSRYTPEEVADRVDYANALSFLLREDLASLPGVAYRWVLDNPHVSLVLSGGTHRRELEDVLVASGAVSFSNEEHRLAASLHTRDFAAA